jgi:hypothetical protein
VSTAFDGMPLDAVAGDVPGDMRAPRRAMNAPHPAEVRERALALLAAGVSVRDVHRRMRIGERTLTRWAELAGVALRDGRTRFGAGKRRGAT